MDIINIAGENYIKADDFMNWINKNSKGKLKLKGNQFIRWIKNQR